VNLDEVAAALGCELLCAERGGDGRDVEAVVASDGMSEILAFHCPHALMLTGLTNVQSVRTAVVADVYAIVYVRGKRPSERVLELARESGIPVLSTSLGMFESCGILYQAGLRGAM
jgi:predicted transcriptional regulator